MPIYQKSYKFSNKIPNRLTISTKIGSTALFYSNPNTDFLKTVMILNTDLHKIVDLSTDLHNAGDFRIFQMPQDGEWLPRVALRLTLGCEPLAPLGRSFFQNALLLGYLNTDFYK